MLAKGLFLAGALAIGLATAPAASAAAQVQASPSAVFHSALTPVEQNLISPLQAIQFARRALGGEPMGTPSLEGRYYVIRWRLPNEVVDFIRVDAVTGQVMR